MTKEISLLNSLLENRREEKFDKQIVSIGNIGSNEVIVAASGIGKVNAAVNTYRLIEEFNPDLVINSGVAGGTGLPVGTLLVADGITYHDVWCGPGTEVGAADGFNTIMQPDGKTLSKIENLCQTERFETGLICSGDKFISTPEEMNIIKSHFPQVKGVDMESGAVAQVCLMTGKPFSILRVISDTPGDEENNITQYQNFWTEAPQKTFNLLKKIVSTL